MLHKQTAHKFGVWNNLASKDQSSYMGKKNIIWILPWLYAFTLYLTCQGCSAVGGEQLRQTITQTLR